MTDATVLLNYIKPKLYDINFSRCYILRLLELVVPVVPELALHFDSLKPISEKLLDRLSEFFPAQVVVRLKFLHGHPMRIPKE